MMSITNQQKRSFAHLYGAQNKKKSRAERRKFQREQYIRTEVTRKLKGLPIFKVGDIVQHVQQHRFVRGVILDPAFVERVWHDVQRLRVRYKDGSVRTVNFEDVKVV